MIAGLFDCLIVISNQAIKQSSNCFWGDNISFFVLTVRPATIDAMAEPAVQPSSSRPSGQHRMAMDFQSSQLRDMNTARSASMSAGIEEEGRASGDSGMSESSMSDTSLGQTSRSVLELPSQSYTRREESEADRARMSQERMRKTQEDFTTPEGVPNQENGGEALEQGFSGRMGGGRRSEQAQQEGGGDQMDQYRQMEEQKARAMLDAASNVAGAAGGAAGKGAAQAMELTEKFLGARALVAIAAKGVMFASGFAIVPLLVLICFVNLEVIHLFFPFIRLSPTQETKLMMKGLDLTSPKKGMYKLLTIVVALLVDLAILGIILFLGFIMTMIVYICSEMSGGVLQWVAGI
jgi:hypothetical protein